MDQLDHSEIEFSSKFLQEFEEQKCLGRGGFGIVFECRNKFDKCDYAVKRIAVPDDEAAIERVLREVKAMAKLDHPNIIRYYHTWLERPPPGWQHQADSQVLLDLSCNSSTAEAILNGLTTNGTVTDEGSSVESQSNKEEINSTNSDSSDDAPHLINGHSTSSIVFEATNNNKEDSENPKEEQKPINPDQVVSRANYTSPEVLVASNNSDLVTSKTNRNYVYLYIQMQLCRQHTLSDWLAMHNSWKDRELQKMRGWFTQLLEAIEYVHRQGLIHRDLKPQNIFFDADEKLKIGDLGLVTQYVEDFEKNNGNPTSRLKNGNQIKSNHTRDVGTRSYMSPEQINGETYDFKVDVFSLGLIYCEMLIPFTTDMERIMSLQDIQQGCIEKFKGRLPSEYHIVEWLTRQDPKLRPTCKELLFEHKKHLIQTKNEIELLNQYLDTIKKSCVELKDPIKINCFLSQKQDDDFKNFLLVKTKNTLLTSCGVHQSLQKIPKYSKANSSLFFKLDQYKDQYKRLIFNIFKSDATDLLVVIYSDIPQQMQIEMDLSEILKHRRYKKIIFIIQESDITKFIKYFLEEKCLSSRRLEIIKDKTFTLNHLTDESQRIILESLVMFQGKKIKLNKLIDENSKDLIDSKTLVRLINNDEVTIGHKLISLGDTQNYYIPRTFNYQTVIKTEIFKEEKVKYLLTISDIDEARLRSLVPENHKISLFQEYDLDKSNDIRSIILNNGQAANQFKQLCQRYPALNIHWLKNESDHLIWQQSQGSISGLHQFIETDESHTKYYSETELLRQTDQYKVMIISDTAGMGKTTVLTSLSQLLKQQVPDLWIVRIDLNNYTKELQEQKVKSSFNTEDINQAVAFLSNDILKLGTPLEQAIFKSYCQKMVVMFDGFDEISPDYREIVIDLVNVLRNSIIKQLWVTTRPNERDILEDRLQQLSFKLEPFSKGDQVKFMTKFWQQTSGLSEVTQEQQKELTDYAGALIDLLTKSIRYKDTELTGIPLQTRMLAEAFEKDFAELFKAKEAKLQLPEKLDLTDLYECFLKKKYDIYQMEKNKLDLSKPRVKIQSDESYAEFIRKHQNLALWTLFKEHKLLLLSEKSYQEFSKNFQLVEDIEDLKKSLMNKSEQEIKSFIDDIKEGKANTGIIDQIIEDKPHFIHRTFAEYLVGKFLVASLDNETIFEFVLQEILMQPAYQVTRAFLNGQLPKSLPKDTLARYGKQIERLWQSDKKNFYNKKGMTLLHLAAEEGTVKIIRFFLNSLKEKHRLAMKKEEDTVKIIRFFLNSLKEHEKILKSLLEATTIYGGRKNTTALQIAAAGGHLDVVQCLMEHGTDVNVKSNDSETVLPWAAQNDKWDVVQCLVKHGADVNVKSNDGKTVLHCAAQKNKWDVVQWLVEHGKANVEATDKYGRTMLNCAAIRNKWDVVQWLVEHEKANVEATDKYGITVLHMAALGNLDVVQWLVEHEKANVEATDNDGKTVLHYAAQWNKLDVVQWLVEHEKANVEATDKYGRTVLHWAAQENKRDVVQWLVEHGKAKVEATDKYGQTVLHWAARGNLDVVQWLVEHEKANVEATDKYGRTVLHRAAQENKWDVVQWLVENGKANVEARDNYGQTVLHSAAWGNLDVVQWLVEHGADVNATDIDGKTPLNLAEVRNGWWDMAQIKIIEYLKNKIVESVGQVSTE